MKAQLGNGLRGWRARGATGRSASAAGAAGQVTCSNCGAGIAVADARCPYCGALNPVGAEKAYMDELEHLRDDTDKLADDAQKGLSENVRRNARWVFGLIVVVALLAIAAVAAVNCASSNDERREVESYQAREAFRERHFAQLDLLYEAADDMALLDYTYSLLDDPGYDAIYSWKHANYLRICNDWQMLESASADAGRVSGTVDDCTWAAMAAIRVAGLDEEGRQLAAGLTAEERERLAGYRAEAERFLQDALQMNADEVQAFVAAAVDEQGYVQRKKLKAAIELRLAQIGRDD